MLNLKRLSNIINDLTQLKRSLRDVDGAYIKNVVKPSIVSTVDFIANQMSSVLGFTSSHMMNAVRNSWTLDMQAQNIIYMDLEKIDKYMPPLKRSPANKKKVDYKYKTKNGFIHVNSYFWFHLFGWGKLGGTRPYQYKVSVVIQTEEGNKITSPYNPSLVGNGGNIKPIKIVRHPGKKARDWYGALRKPASVVFEQEYDKNLNKYFKKIGLG